MFFPLEPAAKDVIYKKETIFSRAGDHRGVAALQGGGGGGTDIKALKVPLRRRTLGYEEGAAWKLLQKEKRAFWVAVGSRNGSRGGGGNGFAKARSQTGIIAAQMGGCIAGKSTPPEGGTASGKPRKEEGCHASNGRRPPVTSNRITSITCEDLRLEKKGKKGTIIYCT